MKKCCFTGYRPQKLAYLKEPKSREYRQLSDLLKKEIIAAADRGYTYFISGFADGVDLLAAEIVLELRHDGRELILEAALPAMNQTQGWADDTRERYFELLDQADYRHCSDTAMTKYSGLRRNDYMIGEADLVIAVYDGKKGGTGYTVRRAREKNRDLWILDPYSFTVEEEEGLF